MFPLLSPLPVLIPKWRDRKDDIPPPGSSLPPSLYHTHTHTSEKPKLAPHSTLQRKREEGGGKKIYPQRSLKHEEALVYSSQEAQDILSSSGNCV